MISKVYLPEEAAEILRLSVDEVIESIQSGEIPAFHVAGKWRITEEALARIVASSTSPTQTSERSASASLAGSIQQNPGGRDISRKDVRVAKDWLWRKLGDIADDLRPHSPSREFTANGKQGIVSIATKDSPTRGGEYFFGFDNQLLETGRPTFLVAVVKPRYLPEPHAFVIPCDKFKAAVDGWGMAKGTRQKKYHVREESGSYYLTRKGMQPVEIREYLNAFHTLR
ncbi:MAG: helix-turn-helix domain-containing protein [Dehalococcoidia bacterium]|nr:helix-turn-helix domain-containing protein [Dehalococcoidia bacterium]